MSRRARLYPLSIGGLLLAAQAAAEVEISGIDGETLDNVRSFLSLEKQACDTPKWRIRHYFNHSQSEIERALRALGYYQPQVQRELRFDSDCWYARFQITAGEPVHLSRVEILIEGDAQSDLDFQERIERQIPQPGDPLHHGRYEAFKNAIRSTALDLGYLRGQFKEKTLRVDPARNQAEIRLVYASGPRFHYGAIRIDQDFLNPFMVQRLINIEPDQPYASSQLAKIQATLSGSGFFSSVMVTPQLDETSDRSVPIEITLTPKKKHHFSAGIGFDSDIGPLLTAAYTNRRINRNGHSAGAAFSLSPVLSSINANYTIPLQKPATDRFSFEAGFKHEDTDSYKSDTSSLSVHISHALAGGWTRDLSASLNQERYLTDGDSKKSHYLVPGISWKHAQSDNPRRPMRGHSLGLEFKGSHDGLLSDFSFLQTRVNGQLVRPVPGGGKFIGRADFGMTLVNDFEQLPTSHRFFTGGASSIRGYEYKELGPRDDDGRVIGGRFLSVLSLEYEHPILSNWGVAAFVDSGNAFNENTLSVKTGVGMGVRWYSPIGPVRLDLGVPLNESDSDFQIHFATGIRL